MAGQFGDAILVEGHATYVACGLKFLQPQGVGGLAASCHVCGMWIEIIRIEATISDEQVMPRMWHVD